jgi:hypothetical protein
MGAYETGTVPIANNTGPGSTIVPPAAVNTFAVSGYARTSALTAISGATITLAGDASRSAVSDANGFYQFANLASGSYTLTITRQGYVFDPGIRKLTLSANPASQDFTGISAQPSGDTIPENLNSARSFPNPWQAGNPYSPVVRFMNLTPKTKILIFTMVGDLVKEFSPEDRTEIQWDVAGENIASGVYVCLMTNDKGETKRQKIAIIR